MLDRTIPYYNIILRCDEYQPQQVTLPDGYVIVPYRDGLAADWARLECAIADFSTVGEAVGYFMAKYPGMGNDDGILFLLDNNGRVTGSCIAWTDERQGRDVNSLHWLVVDSLCQGNGLGRSLCRAAMNRFYLRNQEPVYIHTQPWSWKAILLYISLGFRLQRTDSFSTYANQYDNAMKVLEGVLLPRQYRLLELASDN